MEWLDNIEDQIEKPGYLLFLVSIWMFMVIGLVNIISHDGGKSHILGYSYRQFATIVFVTIGILGWTALMRRPNRDNWLTSTLSWMNARPWTLFAYFAGASAVTWYIVTTPRMLNFPALGTSILGMMAIFGAVLIFHRSEKGASFTIWQRVFQYAFAALIAIEIILQALSFGGLIPGNNAERLSLAPRDRIYFIGENGVANRLANRYGQNVPEFRLEEDTQRVALLGDANLLALPINHADHFAVQLDQSLNHGDIESGEYEAITVAHPDYGPSVFLWDLLFDWFRLEFEPTEVIVFIDLSNDFQVLSETDNINVYTDLDEDGLLVEEINFILRHDYAHEALWGLEGLQPGRFLTSHYMTGRVLRDLFGTSRDEEFLDGYRKLEGETFEAPANDISLPNGFLFYEESNDQSIAITLEQLRQFKLSIDDDNITMRLVTIPVFSEEFYAQGQTTEWTTEFGNADLLLPEAELRAYAEEADISFLGMGEYLASGDWSAADIQGLYFNNGRGLLNESGHSLMAEALQSCFYDESVTADAGCDIR